jgi:hypothetical protein
MKITIDKKYTSVENYEKFKSTVAEMRKNPNMFEDMETTIKGLQRIDKFEVSIAKVKIENIQLFGFFDDVEFCSEVEASGMTWHNGKYGEYIAKLRIYGKITDNGQYFEWAKSNEIGAPEVMNTKIFVEVL